MARIRAVSWGSEEYWMDRISGYLNYTVHPKEALTPRVIFVVVDDGAIVGFIAGHLTRLLMWDGALEWIDVVEQYRRNGIASALLRRLAAWFQEQNAPRICVDVDPANTACGAFYRNHGARDLNPHWLVWDDITVVCREPVA